MDYSSDDSFGREDDEIVQVKRVLREAKARKKTLSSKLSAQSDKYVMDREEMQSAYHKQHAEIRLLKQQLHDSDLELRNARFEIGHSVLRETKKNEEIAILQCEHRSVVNELQAKLDEKDKQHSDKFNHVLKEVVKLSKLLGGLYKSMNDSSYSLNYKSSQQLLATACHDSHSLKCFLTGSDKQQPSSHSLTIAAGSSSPLPAEINSSLDTTLLDMCRHLEEENSTLTSSVDQLKRQLAEAEQEVAKNSLIPHYRLAIVRARSYTANLLEQLKREQFTNESLREQLEATYCDLKRAADEKRSLYKQLSKSTLQGDERVNYHSLRQSAAATLTPPSSSGSGGNSRYSREEGVRSSEGIEELINKVQLSGKSGAEVKQLTDLDREIAELQSKIAVAERSKSQLVGSSYDISHSSNSNNNNYNYNSSSGGIDKDSDE